MHVNTHKTAVFFGAFAGLMHLIWGVLVYLGWAGPITTFLLNLHFVETANTIKPFALGTAVSLILVATIVGYAVGFIAGKVWNWAHK